MKKILTYVVLGFLLLLFFYVRLINISKGITVDEPIWGQRAVNFANAVISFDFKNTYQSGHPGVVTMIASGFTNGIFVLFNKSTSMFKDTTAFNLGSITSLRTGMFIVNTLAIFAIFYVLWKRFKKPVWAVVTILFLGFEPFILKLTRLIHVDAVASLMITLTILFFILYLIENKKKDLLFAAFFLALSLSSKVPTLVFLPYAVLLVLFLAKDKLASLKNLAKIVFIAAIIVYIIWPVLWVDPFYAFKDMFLNTLIALFQSHGAKTITQGPAVSKNYFFYAETISYFVNPLLTVTFAFSLVVSIWQLLTKNFKNFKLLASLQAFFLLFFLAVTVGGKQGDRYLLPSIIMMALSGGLALQILFERVQKNRGALYFLTACLFLAGIMYLRNTIGLIKDYYVSYNSWTPKRAELLMQRTGLGEGLSEAAEYLNRKQGTKKLLVGSWYDSSFTLYFKGKTSDLRNYKVDKPDYVVLYGNMYGRDKTHYATQIIDDFRSVKPEKIIYLNDRPYVWIYKTAFY